MSVRYLQTGDELPLHSTTTFDDNSAEGWWGGVFRCGVALAIAATMAVVASQTAAAATQWEQDEQTPALHGRYEEDFWQNPVAPDPGELYQRLPLTDVEQIPTGGLHGQFDEDFWLNPVAPDPGRLIWPQQWTFDVQEPAGSLFGPPFEDDSWIQNLLPPPAPESLYQPLPLGIDPDFPFTPVATLQPDEDFWPLALLPAPVSGALWQPLPYWHDDGVIPQPAASFQPDEDIWQNPSPPQQATFYQPLPLGDVEQIPAGGLFGQFDEDFWFNPVFPSYPVLSPQLPVQADPDFVAVVLDEDYWQNPVGPVPAIFLQQPLFDDGVWVAAPATAAPNEDYWYEALLPPPVPATMFLWLPYQPDNQEIIVPQPPPPTFVPFFPGRMWRLHKLNKLEKM